jgi:hypothetical protein
MVRRKLATKNKEKEVRPARGSGKGVTEEDEEAVARFMPGGGDASGGDGGMIGVDPLGMS